MKVRIPFAVIALFITVSQFVFANTPVDPDILKKSPNLKLSCPKSSAFNTNASLRYDARAADGSERFLLNIDGTADALQCHRASYGLDAAKGVSILFRCFQKSGEGVWGLTYILNLAYDHSKIELVMIGGENTPMLIKNMSVVSQQSCSLVEK